MYTPPKPIEFDAVKLKLASPEEIRSWSHGEVTKPETINYRTQKPEKDGLFSEKIFGPTRDWECYCGKYKKIRYKGIICDKCGVEVTHSLVRRERMGHIELAVPISHIWFLRGVPSKIGLILDLSVQNLEKVIYFANFIVTSVREDLKEQTIINLKQEFKNKKKVIMNEVERQISQLRNQKAEGDDAGKIEARVVQATLDRDERIKELEEESSGAEKELKELKPMKIISEMTYHDLSLKYGHLFEAGIGAEAVRQLLERVDLVKEIKPLEEELKIAQGIKKDKLIRRVKLFKSLVINKINPDWMILKNVPIIPPDLRPMVPLDGGRFATSDLNDLYRRVINRNNRLKRLVELNAPEVICRNEKRMLQEAVDALIDNSARHSKTVVASTGQKRMLKSIADVLKGKQGRFRQNLLGKRIDYSGRSVIVVGPSLKLNQCGLPKRMALELFKPFVIHHLIKRELVHNVRSASRFIESGRPEVWDILENIVKDAFVFLNRAPTLHRLGIQAFQPILIEGKAIQIHPLVCTAFNADFDGDQMAVHVPLTEGAREEAKTLMLSTHNLLKPATGNPIATPNKDIAWGCYYMTDDGEPTEKIKLFSSTKDAMLANSFGQITLQQKIKVKCDKTLLNKAKKEKIENGFLETTLGRLILNQKLPAEIPYLNEVANVKKLSEAIKLCLEFYGEEKTAEILDDFKETGFKYLTLSGYSWGMDDLPTMPGRDKLIAKGDEEVDTIQKQFEAGLLTQNEYHNKIISVWTMIKDDIIKLTKESLNKRGPVFSMIDSGARGSWGQVTQMMGMKGLVSNPAGEIIELPVKGNFKAGFDVLEYFISTHGTRKGLSDTALRTANAGYLTRRLVDVAQDVIVTEEDCKNSEGVLMTKKESEEMGETLLARILGRFAAEDVIDGKGKKPIVKKNELITEEIGRKLEKLDLEQIRVRSILSCHLKKGVCQKCYGYDLGYNKLAKLGAPVGVVAAQSIGEPGTQLTMRTFHTGGVAGLDITQGLPRVEELFEARSPKRKAFISDVTGLAQVEEDAKTIIGPTGEIITKGIPGQRNIKIKYLEKEEVKYSVSKNKKTSFKKGDKIVKGELLGLDKTSKEVNAEREGIIVSSEENLVVIESEAEKAKEFIIPPGYVLWIKDGAMVERGDQLTEGDLDLHQLFSLKGKEAVQKYLTKEIQHIYTSQGQKLNDKHIEVMVRQMFSRVYIKESGDTDLLPGEIVEKSQLEEANKIAKEKKLKPAEGEELLLGISKVSLSTESFLSAASFQETARVLINAAITGKIDHLEGLKENVIIGRLIPAGTGFKRK
ncbi:MAG: DNA-directed RNA polymerase subunit beta' [Patescibacteria group bacterium]